MNTSEVKNIMKEAFEEARDLKERILAIMEMDLIAGTHLYRFWNQEADCLRQEWMQAIERYSDAAASFMSDE